jgi:hypothetical protein
MTSALAQALGINAGISGTDAGGGACTLGRSGCYNAVVTMSNTPNLYYYRNGTQGRQVGS